MYFRFIEFNFILHIKTVEDKKEKKAEVMLN